MGSTSICLLRIAFFLINAEGAFIHEKNLQGEWLAIFRTRSAPFFTDNSTDTTYTFGQGNGTDLALTREDWLNQSREWVVQEIKVKSQQDTGKITLEIPSIPKVAIMRIFVISDDGIVLHFRIRSPQISQRATYAVILTRSLPITEGDVQHILTKMAASGKSYRREDFFMIQHNMSIFAKPKDNAPNIPVVANYDLQKGSGDWFVLRISNDLPWLVQNTTDTVYRFFHFKNGTYFVINEDWIFGDPPLLVPYWFTTKTYHLPFKYQPGRINVLAETLPLEKLIINMLYTDYSNILVYVLAIKPFGRPMAFHGLILGRTPLLSDESIEQGKQIIIDSVPSLDISKLMEVDHGFAWLPNPSYGLSEKIPEIPIQSNFSNTQAQGDWIELFRNKGSVQEHSKNTLTVLTNGSLSWKLDSGENWTLHNVGYSQPGRFNFSKWNGADTLFLHVLYINYDESLVYAISEEMDNGSFVLDIHIAGRKGLLEVQELSRAFKVIKAATEMAENDFVVINDVGSYCPGLHCSNGDCIPEAYKCDGEIDCSDGTDEQNCTTNDENPCEQCLKSGKCLNNDCFREN